MEVNVDQVPLAEVAEMMTRAGGLLRLELVSGYPNWDMLFTLRSGDTLKSGRRAGRHDIHFLRYGYSGEGPRLLAQFLDRIGWNLTMPTIESLEPGWVLSQVQVGGSVLVRPAQETDDKAIVLEVDGRVSDRAWEWIKGRKLSLLCDPVKNGDIAAVRSLLVAGADVSLKSQFGDTPLQIAAARGHSEMVELLLDYGASQECVSSVHNNLTDRTWERLKGKKLSVLCAPVKSGDDLALRRLIDTGADVNLRDREGSTPLYLAASLGLSGMLELLVKSGAIVEPSVLIHLLERRRFRITPQVANKLIDHGADVNARDYIGATPLHWAASAGDIDLVRCLVSRGADVTAIDRSYERRPLEWARDDAKESLTENGLEEMRRLLTPLIELEQEAQKRKQSEREQAKLRVEQDTRRRGAQLGEERQVTKEVERRNEGILRQVAERRRRGECIKCGLRLGFFQRLLRKSAHEDCDS